MSNDAMKEREVIVSQRPKNEFQEIILIEVLREANIPARFVSLSDVSPHSRPKGFTPRDYEPFFVVVYQNALEIVQQRDQPL